MGDDSSSSLSLSSSDSEEEEATAGKNLTPKKKKGAKKGDLSFDDLAKHGFGGGLSVLNVPAPDRSRNFQADWSWSGGKRKTADDQDKEEGETIEERERTREIANHGAEKAAADTLAEYQFTKKQKRDAAAEQRAASFSKKEKRKRDMGQASRGKSYVEEEKRLLRDRGVYSGFD